VGGVAVVVVEAVCLRMTTGGSASTRSNADDDGGAESDVDA
jgi:hypothetical protein